MRFNKITNRFYNLFKHIIDSRDSAAENKALYLIVGGIVMYGIKHWFEGRGNATVQRG
jgi:hypothetical protein